MLVRLFFLFTIQIEGHKKKKMNGTNWVKETKTIFVEKKYCFIVQWNSVIQYQKI